MARVRLNIKKMRQAVDSRTDQIEVGKVYFLSSFYDKEGALVRVLSKSKAKNRAGWKSSVNIEVVEPVGFDDTDPSLKYYAKGSTHTVNATNLYEKRELASASAKWGQPIGL